MKTLKYEEVYPQEYCDLAEAAHPSTLIEKVHNAKRFHRNESLNLTFADENDFMEHSVIS